MSDRLDRWLRRALDQPAPMWYPSFRPFAEYIKAGDVLCVHLSDKPAREVYVNPFVSVSIDEDGEVAGFEIGNPKQMLDGKAFVFEEQVRR